MLRERVAVTLLLLPFVLWAIADGGVIYLLATALALGLAAAEYGMLFRRQGLRPSLPLLLFGVLALTVARFFQGFASSGTVLALICLAGMAWHVIDYERGASRPGTDFAITLSGTLYLGWIGTYLISLRQLGDGQWWMLVALPTVWVADSAAYFVGGAMGRHRLSPRVSPRKTWEGYLAGVIAGMAFGALLAPLWRIGAGPESALTPSRGAGLGILMGALTPMGDLGVSMIKRELKVKDTGSSIPGHGGALDRIDSWLWAGVVGYLLVAWITRPAGL